MSRSAFPTGPLQAGKVAELTITTIMDARDLMESAGETYAFFFMNGYSGPAVTMPCGTLLLNQQMLDFVCDLPLNNMLASLGPAHDHVKNTLHGAKLAGVEIYDLRKVRQEPSDYPSHVTEAADRLPQKLP